MSFTLESVVHVAKATNYLVPLVPPITTEQTPISQTEKPVEVTSLTQCHKGSISASVVRRKLFPQAPPQAPITASGDFNFPLGNFLEVERSLVSGQPPPSVSQIGTIPKKTCNSHETSKVGKGGNAKSSSKDKNHPKPAKSVTPSQHHPNVERSVIPEKMSDSHRKETGKGNKGDKPEIIVSIPIPPPPASLQNPQPAPPPHVASLLASAAVSSVVSSGQSSSGSGAKSKLILNRCLQCSYTSYNKGDFNLHLDKHRGIRYICPESGCNKYFG